MRGHRLIAGLVAGLLLAVPVFADAGPGTKSGGQDKVQIKAVAVTRQGGAYCFDRPIVYGSVVIAGGRCYSFYVLRTSGGAFLGFGPPGQPMIPPGQLVRLGTPAGAKTKGRLFYLVPIPVRGITIPIDVIRLVTVQVSSQPGRVVITVPRQGSGESTIERFEHPFTQP
jgi:hypothetical protein